jgi:hypothetical protein
MLFNSELLQQALGKLFKCSNFYHGYIRIRTPLVFPDGTVIDLFFKEREEGFILADLGEVLIWLDSLIHPAQERQELLNKMKEAKKDILLTHGTSEQEGVIFINFDEISELPEVLVRLLQTVLGISFLYYLQ